MKKVIYRLQVCLLVLVFFGCDDFLETENKTGLESDKNYQTAEDVSTNMLGIFASVQDVMHKIIIFNELRSDALEPSDTAPIELLSIANYNDNASNSIIKPNEFYRIIVNCNDFLQNAESYKLSGDYMSEDQFNAHMSDVLRIKYWTYWNISKIYGKAYYFDDPLDQIEDIDKVTNLVPMTLEEMIPFLIEKIENSTYDLKSKVDWRALFDANTDFNFYSIDAEALLGELYLWNEDYQMAANIYHRILNDRPDINITLSGETYFKNGYRNLFSSGLSGLNNHILTGVEYTETNGQLNKTGQLFFQEGGERQLLVSKAYVDMSLSQESTDKKDGDFYRGQRTSFNVGDRAVKKYTFAAKPRVPVYRAAELHLKYAEALNQLGEFDKALALLNQGVSKYWNGSNFESPFDDGSWHPKWRNAKGLRGRVKLASRVLDDALSDEEKKTLIDMWILEEGALELAFEGKRLESLIRVSLRYNDPSILAEKVASKFEESQVSTIESLLMNQEKWFWPY
ncbi:RagB/SusD family nutrient uptake outer membrane protein [Tamlana sp. 2201CG12-4]|uniref:RagB/SusD family nutrient uptake outer membrane protein n=1 Tax=Tamlana sp. 2201CG12-4 TaxID=3112582 RepID=UPI002DBBCA25|nr:RagB/SusD family nutrient uptake outer membrane protein [Tamlana sp. 2201CG12-4]MEC3907214.1 RagB/SusD family nutrient uptake outer membrane protein [Tamlana sp. 2201CG12-4]